MSNKVHIQSEVGLGLKRRGLLLGALVTASSAASALSHRAGSAAVAATEGTSYAMARLGGAAIVGIGDSHTERTSAPLATSPGGVRLGGSSFFNQLCTRLGKVMYAQNAGVGGNTTAQMLARFESDVTAHSPRIVHILGGTNDITNTGISLAQTISNLMQMIDRTHAIGAIAIIGTLPPRNDLTLLSKIDKMNLSIKRLASQAGAHLVDYHSVLVSPTTGFYQASLQDDGIHTSALGAKKMAELAASVLDKVLPAYSLPFASSQHASTANLLTNGMFIGDSNLDGLADGWALSGSAATSKATIVSDPNFLGFTQRLTFAGAATRWLQTGVAINKFSAGDRVAFTGRFNSTLEAGAGVVDVQLLFDGSTTLRRLCPLYNWRSDNTNGQFYIEGVVPQATKSLTAHVAAISGAGSIDVGQLAVWNLTRDVPS